MQFHTKHAHGVKTAGGHALVSNLQRWPVTTLFTPDSADTTRQHPSHTDPLPQQHTPLHFANTSVGIATSDLVHSSTSSAEDSEKVCLKTFQRPSGSSTVDHKAEHPQMERRRRKSGGDKKSRSKDVNENEEIPVRRRYSCGDGGGSRSPREDVMMHSNGYGVVGGGGFDAGSEGHYDWWKIRTTSEDTSETTFCLNAGDGDRDDDDDRWSSRRFSTDENHQTTFSDASVDRKWTFSAKDSSPRTSIVNDKSPNLNWSVSFDGNELRTNIDDLIQDMDQEEKWAFGRQEGHVSSVDAWAPVRPVSESALDTMGDNGYSNRHEHAWKFQNSFLDGSTNRRYYSNKFLKTSPENRPPGRVCHSNVQGTFSVDRTPHEEDDAVSVNTESTDTDSVFRRDEMDNLNENRRRFLKELALRGKSHAVDRLAAGYKPSWRQQRADILASLHPAHRRSLENSDDNALEQTTSFSNQRIAPDPNDQISAKLNNTSLTGDSRNDLNTTTSNHNTDSPPHLNQTILTTQLEHFFKTDPFDSPKNSPKHHTNSPKHHPNSPKHHTNSPKHHPNSPKHRTNSPPKASPRKKQPSGDIELWRSGVGEEDGRTEHQRRLDAWVSSIQTHWDSCGSGEELPFSFEDHFQGFEDDGDIFCDFPDLEYEDNEVELYMRDDDKRFGFSVIGGYDEGIAPRVDDVTAGSPADRAELEVGDEIVEVNGKCVHRCSHAEIIAHIHECIRSKSIRLRVKRLKEGEKVPAISRVHDAYIIALEEGARRKLEGASANHKVVPVDMTKGPLPLNPEEAITPFRADSLGAVPAVSSQVHSSKHQSEQPSQPSQNHVQQQNLLTKQQPDSLPVSAPKNKSISPTKPPRQLNLQQKFTPQQSPNQQETQQEPAVHPGQENQVERPSTEQRSPEHWQEHNGVHDLSMPASDKKHKSSPSKHGAMNGSREDLEGTEMMMMMEREQDSPRKGKGGKGKKGEGRGSKAASNPDILLIEDMVNRGEIAPNGNSSAHNSLTQSAHDLSTYSPDSDPGFQHSPHDSSFEAPVSDSGPHREMAIDCPDSFVATVKTPPRYPPSSNAPSASLPRVPPTTPSKNTDSVRDKARTDATLSDAAMVVAGGSQPKPTTEQLDRLRKHQDELRKRREEENRQQQEQDFLRTSLRGSKKLQALENRRMAQGQQVPPAIGIINTAFVDAEEDEEDEDEELVDDVDAVTMAQPMPAERYLKKNAGVEDLLSTLQHVRSRLNSADNTSSTNSTQEVLFLKQLFHNPRFQHAVDVHQKMVDVTSRSPQPRPVATEGSELMTDVCGSCLEPASKNSRSEAVIKELTQLLNKPVMKNLLQAHDAVAEQQSQPVLHTSESDLIDCPLMQYGEESVKIIHLEKTTEHLGATVKNEGDSVIIARIVKGGAAEKSGLLHEGDEILEVNSIEMRGKNVNEVSEILANMSGTITFMIIPAHSGVDEMGKHGEIMHLRALFNYDPEDDPYIPCRELGISFLKGDILHAIQLTDPNWWQAHRDGEEEQHMLAGLIPSKAFQEQRETVRQQLNAEGKENKKRSRMCACGRKERKKKKKKKALYNGGVGEDTEEILTYEEVTRYYPQPNRKRPIVLVSPADIGRQELRERIMESDFDRFAAAVPHTSRPPMAGERHGKDYYFISRSAFEADMLNGKFIEYGEFQGNLYGTSVEAVRQVINQGRICILNLGPESLKIMRDTDLKPYIIFISPPNMEKLRQLQAALGKPHTTDEQLKEMIERGREMEEAFSHYFDYILVNMDLDRSYDELLQEINRIETEPQWVPVVWVNNYM